MPLTVEETVALTAPEPRPEPVRAAVETLRVQRVSVSVTDGYDPAHIVVAAGIPVEITFSEGHGCLAKVMFEQLGIEADLEHGGAIVRLPALDPGDYPFSCGMRMVHGTVTAE
jgi:Cu+-exporting ATPase